MRKVIKIAIIVAALMVGAATMGHAQVFIMEHEENLREETEDVLAWPVNPQNGYGAATDDYVPLGSGILLLAAMGGAYLVCKRKSNRDTK